jgi:hypothetical protein
LCAESGEPCSWILYQHFGNVTSYFVPSRSSTLGYGGACWLRLRLRLRCIGSYACVDCVERRVPGLLLLVLVQGGRARRGGCCEMRAQIWGIGKTERKKYAHTIPCDAHTGSGNRRAGMGGQDLKSIWKRKGWAALACGPGLGDR